MPMMLSRTYDAFISAGAPEDKAREAAEELADHDNRLASIDNQLGVMNGHFSEIDGRFAAIEGGFAGIDARLPSLEGKLTVVIWAMGINAAATIAILGVLLRQA
jgi:hypothetical protein